MLVSFHNLYTAVFAKQICALPNTVSYITPNPRHKYYQMALGTKVNIFINFTYYEKEDESSGIFGWISDNIRNKFNQKLNNYTYAV